MAEHHATCTEGTMLLSINGQIALHKGYSDKCKTAILTWDVRDSDGQYCLETILHNYYLSDAIEAAIGLHDFVPDHLVTVLFKCCIPGSTFMPGLLEKSRRRMAEHFPTIN